MTALAGQSSVNAQSSVDRNTRKTALKTMCMLCGKESGDTICHACADRIRGEALSKKKRDYKGES